MSGFRRTVVVRANRRFLHLVDGDGKICLSINIWYEHNLIKSVDVSNFCFPFARIINEMNYLVNSKSSNVAGKAAELLELPFDV